MGTDAGSGVREEEPLHEPIFWADTSVTAVVAPAPEGPQNQPVRVHSLTELVAAFGDIGGSPLATAVTDFLVNGGQVALAVRSDDGAAALAALDEGPSFQLLVIDHQLLDGRYAEAHALCERRHAFLVTDALPDGTVPPGLGANAAVYHPTLLGTDGATHPAGPAVAGVYARTDAARGVWRAPAGMTAQVVGAADVSRALTTRELSILNTRRVNGLRLMPDGSVVVWGARTTSSDPDQHYVAVRRLILFLEESLEQGLAWAASEPSTEELWAKVCSEVKQFLTRLWREGALPGERPAEAFFVTCDETTTTPEQLGRGELVCLVGIAPISPGEFVTVPITFATAGRPQ